MTDTKHQFLMQLYYSKIQIPLFFKPSSLCYIHTPTQISVSSFHVENI